MDDTLYDPVRWATTEYGHAALRDARRTARLVDVAAGVAARPDACVARVFAAPRARAAAYDFLENDAVRPRALVAASARATATRAAATPLVLVAADGCALTHRDPDGRRGMGSIGQRRNDGRGLQTMDAVAMTEAGRVLGLAGLVVWRRPLTPVATSHKRRPVARREIKHWLALQHQVDAAFAAHAPATTVVMLRDAGADAWAVLCDDDRTASPRRFTVVRAAHDRRAGVHATGTAADVDTHLWPLVRRASLGGRRRVDLGAGHGRAPRRRAALECRVARVTLDLRQVPASTHVQVVRWAIWVRERGRVPRGEERLEWLLLTDWPTPTLAAAWRVVGWYLLRWRVEDHHKTWKKSGSDVEATALGSRAAVARWIAIHAAVSARALALVHAARDPTTAAAPATTVLHADELTALRTLRASEGDATPADLTVAQAAELIAIRGGYTPQRGRRFGPRTLRAGLEQVELAARVIATLAPATNRRRKRR